MKLAQRSVNSRKMKSQRGSPFLSGTLYLGGPIADLKKAITLAPELENELQRPLAEAQRNQDVAPIPASLGLQYGL